MRKIKYAMEQVISVPDDWTDEEICECLALNANGKDFIWCNEKEELFEEK